MKKNFPEGVCLVRGTPEVESRSPEAEDLQAELTDPGRVLGSPRAAPYLQKQGSGVSPPPRPWLCLLGQGHDQGQTALSWPCPVYH